MISFYCLIAVKVFLESFRLVHVFGQNFYYSRVFAYIESYIDKTTHVSVAGFTSSVQFRPM